MGDDQRGRIRLVDLGDHRPEAEGSVVRPGRHRRHHGRGHAPTAFTGRRPPTDPGDRAIVVEGGQTDLAQHPVVDGVGGHQVEGQPASTTFVPPGDPPASRLEVGRFRDGRPAPDLGIRPPGDEVTSVAITPRP